MSPAELVDEERYLAGMEPRRAVWLARSLDAARSEPRRSYAASRAVALSRPHGKRLAGCAKRGVEVKCRCKGKRDVRWFTCRSHLTCERCQMQRSKRLSARIHAGLEAAMREAEPGERLVLLTITLRHSGDIEADRTALARGWRRFYKMLHRRGRRYPYVGTWEITPGDDKQGHVHAHVVVLWPYLDWGAVRELWLAACPESERITFVANRRDGKPSSARSAAKYLSKYVSKGVQTDEFTPQMRADVLVATYQSRWIFTSRRFWQPFKPCCKTCNTPVIRVGFRWHGKAEPAWREWWQVPPPVPIQASFEL